MFWRRDPTGKTNSSKRLASNWPRDGAIMKGVAVEVKGARWLCATQVKQKGGSWEDVSYGWMPFRYSQYYLEKMD